MSELVMLVRLGGEARQLSLILLQPLGDLVFERELGRLGASCQLDRAR